MHFHQSTAVQYDQLDDVALLQIAVLQQDLLKRDVEEAKKRKDPEAMHRSDIFWVFLLASSASF